MSAGGKWQGQDRTPRLPACAAPCGPLSRPCCRDTKRMSPVPPTFPGRLTPARISSRVCATALRRLHSRCLLGPPTGSCEADPTGRGETEARGP